MTKIAKRIIERAVAIQQIAAPTFQEETRAVYVAEQFRAEGLVDVRMDDLHNVYARLPGKEPGAAPIVVSAHTDTVFPAETDLTIRKDGNHIYGPGLGDNSMGVAGLFGLLWQLREQDNVLPVDLWLVANVGEEGLGDLKGMRAVVEHFGDTPRAYIILEGMSLGQVYHRALGVRRYRVEVKTPGGHSWANFGVPSAIHEISKIVNQISGLAVSKAPATSFNVGLISGGTSINTIAQKAEIYVDLRSESPDALQALYTQVEGLFKAANKKDVQVFYEVVGNRPAGEISPDHPLVLVALECVAAQKLTAKRSIGSTDANIPLSMGLPAVCVGLTSGRGAHTTEEYVDTAPIGKGVAQLVDLVTRVSMMA